MAIAVAEGARAAHRGARGPCRAQATDRFERIVESKDTSAHFMRLGEASLSLDHPVDDRLAVLALADLEVRRVLGRLDELPSGYTRNSRGRSPRSGRRR
jgi:hypothetical protein